MKNESLDGVEVTPEMQRRANCIARQHGYSRATTIVVGTVDRVVSHVNYGYRQYTTGEYVANAYRDHFGWKNTYYQRAETVIEIAR